MKIHKNRKGKGDQKIAAAPSSTPPALTQAESPWVKFLGRDLLTEMREKMEIDAGGCLYQSVHPSESKWAREMFPHLVDRMVALSAPPHDLQKEEVTVIGDGHAVRPIDFGYLTQGFLYHPINGKRYSYSNARQVANWLEHAIALDQIIDAIGPYAGSKYVVISQQQLWTDKIVHAVSQYLGYDLDDKSRNKIEGALQSAEKKRCQAIQRYLTLMTGRPAKVTIVTDRDIYDDLCCVRDQVLADAGTSLDQLQKMFPTMQGLDGATLAWTIHTGAFIELLQKSGYVQTRKSIIVEPWQHATAENAPRKIFNEKVFSNGNAYFEPGGNQEHVGYVGYIGAIATGQGNRPCEVWSIGAVPNIANHKQFLNEEQTEYGGKGGYNYGRYPLASGFFKYPYPMHVSEALRLTANAAFMWSVNTLTSDNMNLGVQKILDRSRDYTYLNQLINDDLSEDPNLSSRQCRGLQEDYAELMCKDTLALVELLRKHLGWIFEGRSISPDKPPFPVDPNPRPFNPRTMIVPRIQVEWGL